MQYNPPTGGAANDPFVGKNVAAGIQGSKIPPGAAEFPQRELVNIITDAGMAPTNADLAQASQAIRSGKLNFFADTGTADTLLIKPGRAYADVGAGTAFSILKGNTPNATTAPTLTVSGLTLTIVREDGSALAAGDLPANCLFTVRSDGTRLHVQGLRKGEVVGSITQQQILNITGLPSPGTGFGGTQVRTGYQPSGPDTSVLTASFNAPCAGTVTAFSILISTAQPGFSNAVEIDKNGTQIAGSADSVGGTVTNVTTASVAKGDAIVIKSTVITTQAATYNTTQRFIYNFIPS